MSVLEKTWKVLTHELTLIGGILAYLLGIFDVIFHLLQSTSGLWFSVVSVSATQFLPVFDISQSTQQTILLVAAAVYVVVLLEKLHDRIAKRLDKTKND